MYEVALFVEDFAHQQVIGALVCRIARECEIQIRLDWRNAVGGHGRVDSELNDFLRDLERQGSGRPDLIVVATDSNCKGLNERERELTREAISPMVFAIADPHIERWLLLDGLAFKSVFGKGCDAPDQKCHRGRYKQLLLEAICASGTKPRLGGIEYAADIVQWMNIDQASRDDRSFGRFAEILRHTFLTWRK